MFRSAVTVTLDGDLDQPRLNALREALRLKREGRLGDAWDQIQGRRLDDVPDGRVQVLLYREDLAGPWEFRVNAEGEPSVETLRAVEAELSAAARAAGFTVTGVTPPAE